MITIIIDEGTTFQIMLVSEAIALDKTLLEYNHINKRKTR